MSVFLRHHTQFTVITTTTTTTTTTITTTAAAHIVCVYYKHNNAFFQWTKVFIELFNMQNINVSNRNHLLLSTPFFPYNLMLCSINIVVLIINASKTKDLHTIMHAKVILLVLMRMRKMRGEICDGGVAFS